MQSYYRWLSLLAWLPAGAAAFQPLITDDTGTQGAGGNQLEFGYTRFVEKEPGTKTVATTLPFVYTLGLTDALDGYIGGSAVRFRPNAPDNPQTGAGNTLAGLKWRFYEHEASKVSLALRSEIRFPVSERAENRGLGDAKSNAGAALLLSQETGFGAIHANLAVSSRRYALPGNQAIHRDALWRLSVAPVFDITEQWRIVFDAGLVTNPHSAEKYRMGYVEAGAIYAPTRNLDLAFGIIRDIDHQGHRVHMVTAGVTWRFR
ncbi:MAG: transporter [Betaproteobacteria bacterium]